MTGATIINREHHQHNGGGRAYARAVLRAKQHMVRESTAGASAAAALDILEERWKDSTSGGDLRIAFLLLCSYATTRTGVRGACLPQRRLEHTTYIFTFHCVPVFVQH